MAEVKWIKITTDMFDNRKIKHLRKLPDGNNLVLIWIMLLTMAGRCNSHGMIFLTETFPYSSKMLADELEFEENTVKLALNVFETLGMIQFNGDFMEITGWEEYQNVDGMDKIREQTRQRVAKYREKQLCNVTGNVTVTQGNATDIDIDKELDKDNKKKESIKKEKPVRYQIPPTIEMVRSYCAERKNTVDAEKFFDFYEMKGWMVGKDKMKDWQAAVRTWERQNGDTKAVKDQALIEKGRKAQEENERQMEEQHKREMEKFKEENPEEWANIQERAKGHDMSAVIATALGGR